jgi:hypothetical protein
MSSTAAGVSSTAAGASSAAAGGSSGGLGGFAGNSNGGNVGSGGADGGMDAPVTKADVVAIRASEKLGIPSYFTAPSLWSQLSQAAPTVGIAIVNPSSGPGFSVDSNLASSVAAARRAGVTVLGFVDTAGGSRSTFTVQGDVDRYFQWYDVNGIFFNNASRDCAREPYHEALFQYVKSASSSAVVVLNPGTTTPECFVAAADILVTYNDVFALYDSYQPLGWESAYPSSRFWHLVYATASQDMPAAVDLSKQRGAGWIYVTPDDLPNPWDSLPPDAYWNAELAAAAAR